MPIELLLLLLAWAATVSLIVVVPWAVIRLTVCVLEADLSPQGADRAQPHESAGEPPVTAPSHESDDAVPPTAIANEDDR